MGPMDIGRADVGPQYGNPLTISSKVLLGIYLIVPAAYLIVLVDILFLNQVLMTSLPYSPEALRLFTVFFVLPHIIASAMTLLDREYAGYYKLKLGIALPIICIVTVGLPFFLGQQMTFIVYAVYTIYHVLGQQIGVSRLLMRNVDNNFWTWKWLGIGRSIPVYFYMFRSNLPPYMRADWFSIEWIYILLIPLTFYAWRAAGKSETRVGFYYLWSTHAMIAGSIGAFLLNWTFL